MLLVVYNIEDEVITNSVLEKAAEFGGINQILPNAFLLDTSIEITEVFDAIKVALSNKGRIILAIIRRNEINGWLSTASVDWINSKVF